MFSGEIIPGGVAVTGGIISGFGSYPAKKIIDIEGRFIAPGFINAHVHIESSMACVTEFCGAPDCRTFAEDVVTGKALLNDCIMLRKRDIDNIL